MSNKSRTESSAAEPISEQDGWPRELLRRNAKSRPANRSDPEFPVLNSEISGLGTQGTISGVHHNAAELFESASVQMRAGVANGVVSLSLSRVESTWRSGVHSVGLLTESTGESEIGDKSETVTRLCRSELVSEVPSGGKDSERSVTA